MAKHNNGKALDEVLAETAAAGTAAFKRLGDGDDLQEQILTGMDNVVQSDEPIWSLDYDIPSDLRESGECPCPHRALLMMGACPFTKSQKVMTQTVLDSAPMQILLAHWRKYPSVIIRLLRFHDSQILTIKKIVAEELRKELVRLHTSLIERMISAEKKLCEMNKLMDEKEAAGEKITDKDRRAAERIKNNAVRAILKDSAEALAAASNAAAAFDERDVIKDAIKDVRRGLQDSLRSVALAFDAEMRQKGDKPSTIDRKDLGTPEMPDYHTLRHQDQREYRFHSRNTMGTVLVHYVVGGVVRQVQDLPAAEAEKLWRKLKNEGYQRQKGKGE